MSEKHEPVQAVIVYKYTCPFCGKESVDEDKITHCKSCNHNLELIV